jgi:hypothetical protein
MAGRKTARNLWEWSEDASIEAFELVVKEDWESMGDFYNAGAVESDRMLFWFGMGWVFEKNEISSGRVTHPEDNWRLTDIEGFDAATPPTNVNPQMN